MCIHLSLGKQSSEANYHYEDFYSIRPLSSIFFILDNEARNQYAYLSYYSSVCKENNNKIYPLLSAVFRLSTELRALDILILKLGL